MSKTWYDQVIQMPPEEQQRFVDTMEHLLGIDLLTGIALDEGSVGTIWGPCMGTKDDWVDGVCNCDACQHADLLAEQGLDWDVEYAKAKDRGFDREEE